MLYPTLEKKNEKGKGNDFFTSPIIHQNRKKLFWKWLKNNSLNPNLNTRCQKVENIGRQTNSKLLTNLKS